MVIFYQSKGIPFVQGQRATIFMTQPGQMKWEYEFEYGAPFIPDYGTVEKWGKEKRIRFAIFLRHLLPLYKND